MDIFSVCIGAAGVWLYSKWKKKDNEEETKNTTVLENQDAETEDNESLNYVSLSENTPPKDLILERVINLLKDGKNVFITGGAGTGKSYLLQQIKQYYPFLTLTSTTGVSAININGQTVHSWAGVGICKHSIESVANSIMKNGVKYKQLALCKMLAIDEISMLKSETMEYIDKVLKIVRNNNAPFGGIQTILIGDFFQLPPVVRDNEHPNRKLQDSDYCFNCSTWKDLNLVPVVLKEVKRQTDKEFVKVLNNLREGKTELDDLKIIWNREQEVQEFLRSEEANNILKLFSTNESADNYNLQRLAQLEYPETSLVAEDGIKWYDDNDICVEIDHIDKDSDEWKKFDTDCKAPLKLQLKCDLKLKTGCRVMLLKNLDIANGLANGSCGTVVNIKPNAVEVLFDTNHKIVPIQRVDFEMPVNTKSKTIQITNEDGYTSKIIATKKKIVRNQYPLRLAYGITIHKSQGMTFDKLIVDCGRVFADGQAYVALSRTRSLQGLYPINFDHTTVTVSNAVVDFYKQLDDISVINDLTTMNTEANEKEKLIRQAIEEEKKLKIKYHSNPLYKNEDTVRTVKPQRLAYGSELNGEKSENPYPFEDDKLYLKAFCELRQESRSFKVENIQDIEIL